MFASCVVHLIHLVGSLLCWSPRLWLHAVDPFNYEDQDGAAARSESVSDTKYEPPFPDEREDLMVLFTPETCTPGACRHREMMSREIAELPGTS